MTFWQPMVSVRLVDDDEGVPVARVMFSDVALTLPPEAVSFVAGVLRVAVPTSFTVPANVTVVERWLPPTAEQVRLAVEALDAVVIEQLLIREQHAALDEPLGAMIRRAVALAVSGAEVED